MTDPSSWAGEARALARLALPVVLTQVGMVFMGIVDVMMVGRLGEEALASVAVGDTYAFVILIVPLGILLALDPLVSQAWGGGDRAACGRAFQRGLVLAAGLAVPLSGAWLLAGPVLSAFGQPAAIVPLAATYVLWLIPGGLPVLGFQVLRQTLQGMGRVREVLAVTLAANVVNALADWVLIYGRLGSPALGVQGAGLATSLSRWFLFGALLALGLRSGLREIWPGWSRRIVARASLVRILRLGAPIGLSYGLEVWGFCAMTFLMGWLGAVELAGHTIALKLASLAFMVPMGLSVATSVRVGQAIGRRDGSGARRASAAGLVVGGSFMLASAAAFLAFPRPLARLFTDQAAVVAMAASLLPMAALFQVFDGLQAVGFGVLRGTGDTRVPLLINALGYYLVGLPSGYVLTFVVGIGPRGLWVGLVLALGLVAALILGRIRVRFRREIEPLALEAH